MYVDRALGKDSAFQVAGGGALVPLKKIKEGTKPEPKTAQEAVDVVKAIAGLETQPTLPLGELLHALRVCWDVIGAEKPSWLSYVRKAIARTDELYFAYDK